MTETRRDGVPPGTGHTAADFAVMNRRALLTGAGIAATAASAVLVAAPAHAFNATPAENAPRYKDSEHAKTFYRIASR